MREIEAKLENPDGFYSLLLEAHEQLDEEDSLALSQALVYVFANQIGSMAVIEDLVESTIQALKM